MKGLTVKRVVVIAAASLCLSLAALASSSSSRSQDGDADPGIREPFVGAWRLVWLEEPGPDGKIHRADCTGMFVFTRDGHASVQVMYRSPEAGAAAGPVQYATGGYEATFGRYEVDEGSSTFTYHVEGGLVRSLVGKDLKRAYELTGRRLIIKSTDPGERWRVVWEHY